jgi:hypothetical protein
MIQAFENANPGYAHIGVIAGMWLQHRRNVWVFEQKCGPYQDPPSMHDGYTK